MRKPVVFTRLAQSEIDAAARFYEDCEEGLGERFYRRVDEAAEKIERLPFGFQKVYKDMRRCGLEQFTDFALWFRVLEDNSLVIACLSSRRNPALIKKRAARFPRPDLG